MARARNIKPAFFTNDKLADVEPLARLLFIGLWTIADREGRMEDRPRRIKAEVLPYDNCDIEVLLNQLADQGFILRYTAQNQRFIQVENFNKHQYPHLKEAESTIPAPVKSGASTVQAPDTNSINPPESLNPITESLNPITHSSKSDSRFDTWYSAYPNKVGKQKARQAFQKIDWHEVDFADVMAALERHKQSEQWTKDGGKFIPHPTTYLNRGGWEDELKPATGNAATEPRGYSRDPDEAANQLRRELEQAQRDAQHGGDNIRHLRRDTA